jgi:hypothetical protein
LRSTPYPGSVQSLVCAAYLVSEGSCVMCVPRSFGAELPGTRWVPLAGPIARYPWSVLWRADDHAAPVAVVREHAQRSAARLGWLDPDPRRTTRAGPDRRWCGDHIR